MKRPGNADGKPQDDDPKDGESEPSPQEKLDALMRAMPKGQLSILAQIFQQWQGPLPPPEWLEGYNRVTPGLADRLMRCFEVQVNHRVGIEGAVVSGNVRAQDRGQWFAFILALAVLAFATLLVMRGHVGWGIGVAVGNVLTLAGVFVYGREGQRAERKQKIDQIVGPREPPPGD